MAVAPGPGPRPGPSAAAAPAAACPLLFCAASASPAATPTTSTAEAIPATMRFEGVISGSCVEIRLTVESQQRSLRAPFRAAGKPLCERCQPAVRATAPRQRFESGTGARGACSRLAGSDDPAVGHTSRHGRLAQLGERLVYTQE